MQLVFHAGAHFTEEDRVMECLLRNSELFQARGTVVPEPKKYRKLVRQTLVAAQKEPPEHDAKIALLGAMLDGAQADRVLLSNAQLFGAPRAALRKGLLYPRAPRRVAVLADIFGDETIELFMAIRNPATHLPACFEKSPQATISEFMRGADPLTIRWSETISRIRAAAPSVKITIWCNEDAPLMWYEIIRNIAGLEEGAHITGRFDLLSAIMSQAGLARLETYLASKPQLTEGQVQKAAIVFLEKYALDDAMEEVIDLPGWTADLMSEMTDIYDADVRTLSQIPGVKVLLP